MALTGDIVVALGRVQVEPSGDSVVILCTTAASRRYRTGVLVGGIRTTVEPPGDTVVETDYLWSH